MTRHHSRVGYTLLEVLLATSISIVLLAALYATLKLHLTTAQWGPRAAERIQLARSISALIRQDVSQLVIPDTRDQSVRVVVGESGQQQAATRHTGFRGDPNWIEFYTDAPYFDPQDSHQVAAGLARVRYEISIGGRRGTDGLTQSVVLTRTEVPAELASSWDAGRDGAATWARRQIVTSELDWLRFEFWDQENGVWTQQWKAPANRPGTPPSAFRISFALRQLPGAPSVASSVAHDVHIAVYHVASPSRIRALVPQASQTAQSVLPTRLVPRGATSEPLVR